MAVDYTGITFSDTSNNYYDAWVPGIYYKKKQVNKKDLLFQRYKENLLKYA